MAANGSRATRSSEPESKLRMVARPAGWVAPGGLDGVEDICAWLGTYGERLCTVRNSGQGQDLAGSTNLV